MKKFGYDIMDMLCRNMRNEIMTIQQAANLFTRIR